MKKMIYAISLIIITCLLLMVFAGCSDNNIENEGEKKSDKLVTESSLNQEEPASTQKEQETDYKTAAEKQMAKPVDGETVAIIKIKGFGDIKVKFFEDKAPKAVENFTTHAKNGYYNGLTFHRVMNEFMIQGGDPEGNGLGGESIWGEGFGTELTPELVPYRGSLCMAMSSQPNSIGSQFFITQANYNEEMESYMRNGGYPAGLLEQYKNYGGYLSLYLQYTVFGQVYEGLDVLDKVAAVKTTSVPLVVDGVNYGTQDDKPVEDVIIEKIEVTTYKAK